jgi:hypothetical protein
MAGELMTLTKKPSAPPIEPGVAAVRCGTAAWTESERRLALYFERAEPLELGWCRWRLVGRCLSAPPYLTAYEVLPLMRLLWKRSCGSRSPAGPSRAVLKPPYTRWG